MHNAMEGCVPLRRQGPFSVSSFLLLLFHAQPGRVGVATVSVARSGEGRLNDGRGAVVGQLQVHETVEIVQDFWISEHRRTPVCIDSALQLGMRILDLALQLRHVHGMDGWVARVAHIDLVVGEGCEVGRMRLLAR